jgi:hypothetical protein
VDVQNKHFVVLVVRGCQQRICDVLSVAASPALTFNPALPVAAIEAKATITIIAPNPAVRTGVQEMGVTPAAWAGLTRINRDPGSKFLYMGI